MGGGTIFKFNYPSLSTANLFVTTLTMFTAFLLNFRIFQTVFSNLLITLNNHFQLINITPNLDSYIRFGVPYFFFALIKPIGNIA